MTDPTVGVDVSGGQIQGIVGAGSVVIENLTFYSRAAEEPAQTACAEPIGPCPYPGLAYFGPSDADLFFGRDAAITRLAEAVGRQSFTALVGASGSGKSSVVLAGLAPRLHRAGNWRFSHFRIGTELESNPFLALARALAPLYVASDSDVERLKNTKLLATSLAAGELTLRDVFADCRSRNKGRRILLIADQFEEAFTLVADDAIRERFIDTLLAGFPDPAAGGVPDICLILTMRADFYGRALRHRPLTDALQNHVENLGPMNREELQAAIVCPAQNAEVAFEPGMVETLLDTVRSKPGGLPLLQFALREMWGRQERKTITRKSYDEIGGVEGALAQRAETVFAGLTKNGADAAMHKAFQRLFTRLVTLGEGQEDTRRVVERAELGDEVWGVAQRLAGEENRLVVTNRLEVTNASSARETVEVVHEALIRNWPKLVDWINRDRAFQSWLRLIRSGVELWSANPDDEGTLLRGGMLAQARDWLARRRDDLGPKELAFVEASVALSRRVEAEKEAALEREKARLAEIAAAQVSTARMQRRMQGALVAVAMAVLLGLGVAGWQYGINLARQGELDRAQGELVTEQVESKRRQAQLDRGQINLLAELAAVEQLRGNFDSALRLAAHGVRLHLGFDRDVTAASPAAAALAAAVSQSDWQLILDEHGSQVNSTAFSPDASRVVTGSWDRTARVWDITTGEVITVLHGHESEVNCAAFSPDGSRIVTASFDRTARIWHAGSGIKIAVLIGHADKLNSAAFSPDGSHIVTASADGSARIWNAETGTVIAVLSGHSDIVLWAVFSPDGSRIVTASSDLTARVWDAATGKEIVVLRGHAMQPNSAAFSPDGSRIVTASSDRTARIWDTATGQKIAALQGHEDAVVAASFSPDGSRIVTASWDKTVRIWDAVTGNDIAVLRGHEDIVVSAAFSPDGSQIVTGSGDKTARIWDVRVGRNFTVLHGHGDQVLSAIFSPDGSRIVTGSLDKTAQVWDVSTGNAIGILRGHDEEVNFAAYGPDGSKIVTASGDGTARIWDAETGTVVSVLSGHTDSVLWANFSPDGSRIVTVSSDSTVRLWDVATGRETRILGNHSDQVLSAAFSPDGARIVTASTDATARVWDAATGQEIASFRQHQGQVSSAAFSPDGLKIVTASLDMTARTWSAATGEEIVVLRGHDSNVGFAAFSPDGLRIVTASYDRTARIWDATTAKMIAILNGHNAQVNFAVFSPEGSRVVTASWDSTARIWDVRFTTMSAMNLLAELCMRRLGRRLAKLTRNEMRFAGYSDNTPEIDVCAARE